MPPEVPTTAKQAVVQKHKYVYRNASSEHCFDQSGFISAVGVTDIRSRLYTGAHPANFKGGVLKRS